METITQWVSKEPNETITITISKVGSSKVVELDYVTDLEILSQEHKKAKGAKAKREIAQKYKEVAIEMNKNYKSPIYIPEI